MDRDAFADELFGVFAAIADYAETGEIRSVRSPTAVVAAFEDHEIVAHLYLSERINPYLDSFAFFKERSELLGAMVQLIVTIN